MRKKLQCPQCGNDRHFMVMATIPVVVRARPGEALNDGRTAVVDTYEDDKVRRSFNDEHVMCMECSEPAAMVGDDSEDGPVYVEQVPVAGSKCEDDNCDGRVDEEGVCGYCGLCCE